MTFEVHKQEPAAAKNRPWLTGAYNDDLLGWVQDLTTGADDSEIAPSTVAMLQFRKQVGAHAPLSSSYLPPLQWVMDFFKRDTYNAGMYGSVKRFLNDLSAAGSKGGGVLNPYTSVASEPSVWGLVQWREEEVFAYGDKFLAAAHSGDVPKGLKIASGMAASGRAPQEWLVSFWERYKKSVDRYSIAPKSTKADWDAVLHGLASAPNLPEEIVREMMERMLSRETDYFVQTYLLSSLLWNEQALTPEIYMEFLSKGSENLRKQGVHAEPVPYHGTRNLEELRQLTGLTPNLKSMKFDTTYSNLNLRLEQGAIWKKSLQKIRNSENDLSLSEFSTLSRHWNNYGQRNWRHGQHVRLDRFTDHLYLAREGKKLREKLADEQLKPAPWNSNRVLALPAVGDRLRTVRSVAASTGLDEEGNIPVEWLLELL